MNLVLSVRITAPGTAILRSTNPLLSDRAFAARSCEAFEWLDDLVRAIGALDAPVPCSPPLERFFLPGEDEIERVAGKPIEY